MKLELREFVEAVKNMHNRSGVKRTRLMLKLRPHQARKTFVIKATDGQSTITTRVAHQGQLKMVEHLVNNFVSTCTAATAQAAEAASASHAAAPQSNATSSPAPAAAGKNSNAAAPAAGGGGKKAGGNANNNNNNNNNAKGGGAKKKGKK